MVVWFTYCFCSFYCNFFDAARKPFQHGELNSIFTVSGIVIHVTLPLAVDLLDNTYQGR